MRVRTVAVTFVAGLFPGLASSQVPEGPEFKVNTYTTGAQLCARVASDPAGNFVIAWTGVDGSFAGAFARRYDAFGAPLDAEEFRLNSFTTDTQEGHVVSAASDGRLNFAWHAFSPSSDGFSVYSRSYDASGAPDGEEFRVNTYTTGFQVDASIGTDASGRFVVIWTDGEQDGSDRGVFGQRFDANGAPLGAEFRVNAYTTGPQFASHQAVAVSADGSFVVAWESYELDANSRRVFAQRLDGGGSPVGPEFQVNTDPTGSVTNVSVASDSAGNFVVVWESIPGPFSEWDIVARRYDAAGVAQGPEFVVNSETAGSQHEAKVAFGPRGRFVVVWGGPRSAVYGADYDIFARVFNGVGPVTEDFAVNTVTTGFQVNPSIAIDAAGDFVVAWTSVEGAGESEVYARRFRSDLIFADGFETGDLSAWDAAATDGGDLGANPAAALDSTSVGLQGVANDTAGLYVQDDTPDDELRYRARFWLDPNGFDPGEATGHLRTRMFIAFTGAPSRRVATVVLRRQGGVYALMGRARLDIGSQADTPFFDISDGPHAVEVDLKPATAPGVFDGSFEIVIDGVSMMRLTGLDNSLAAVDFARLGALAVKSGASGALYWDEFESWRVGLTEP